MAITLRIWNRPPKAGPVWPENAVFCGTWTNAAIALPRWAADAARALLELGAADEDASEEWVASPESKDVTLLENAELLTVISLDEEACPTIRPTDPVRREEGAGVHQIPVPLNWRRVDDGQKPRWIQGLGFFLKEIISF